VQEEGYPPPAEMPIKQLQFTPFKAPAPAKVSDASSKGSIESAEDAEGGASSNAEVCASVFPPLATPPSHCFQHVVCSALACTGLTPSHAPCLPNTILQLPGASAAAAAAASMNINVFLRVRPLPHEYEGNRTLTVMDESSVALCAPPVEPNQRDYKGDSVAVQDKVELSEQDK